MKQALISLAFLGLQIPSASGCKVFNVESNVLGDALNFFAMSEQDISKTGRPSFRNEDSTLFMFHDSEYGAEGRWTIGESLNSDRALAYIDSWAVHPVLVHAAHDTWNLKWQVTDSSGGWVMDPTVVVTCAPREDGNFPDTTFFFDSGLPELETSGFFVEVEKSSSQLSDGSLYALVGHGTIETAILMYKFVDNKNERSVWVIGQNPGTDIGFAHVRDSADEATQIESEAWHFLENGEWTVGHSAVLIKGDVEYNVYHNLRQHRSIKYVPEGQSFFILKNFVPIPSLGFGTGALSNPESSIATALRSDYRFLDLAREYHNEHIVGSLLEAHAQDESFPSRNELFLLSKVWPTELGFNPTSQAIAQSLVDLKTNYIDSYLLHWPACYRHIQWMRCEEAVEPEATWRESWRALEKAYAEGLVMSIGVSNFGLDLLEQLADFASVQPHIVQNFADPANLDIEVRNYCYANEILYIPYAMQRNYDSLSPELKARFDELGATHGKSPNEVLMRSFFQSRAAIIPRSDNPDHIVSNGRNVFGWKLSNDEMLSLGWPRHGSDEEL